MFLAQWDLTGSCISSNEPHTGGRENHMKIKAPILARIAILFLSALVIASAVVFSFSYNHILRVAEAQSVEVSSAAITAALTAIGSKEHFYDLYDDEEFREQVHKSFRYICKRVASGIRTCIRLMKKGRGIMLSVRRKATKMMSAYRKN